MTQNLTIKEKNENELIKSEIKEFVNAEWDCKGSLLHTAVSLNNMVLVRQCFDFGIDVNKVDYSGESALFYCQTLEIAKFLVEHGIDVNILNAKGETAVVHLYRRVNIEIIRYLISNTDLDLTDNSYSASTLLGKMISYDESDFSLIQMVVSRTKDVNRINTHGNSYLISAAQNKKCKNIVLLLIEAGVDLYVRDQGEKNFYDVTFKYMQAEIQKRYPEFMKRKDMTEQQRQRLDKLKHLNLI